MRISFALLIAYLGASTLACAADALPPAPLAGQAVVVVGSVTASHGQERHALRNGAEIAEGTTVDTAAGGHLYIVTVDQGFISVRPNSSVTIQRYRYDAAKPEKTEIKIVLNHGVVRAISGRGAQAARENYRMNTPVVALGIRGTDFSVFADAATTRAEVRRGGIVLTPFGADCAPSGSGPCEGPRAAQLFTGERNVLLQFRRGDVKPVALDGSFSYLRPDRTEPPRKGEAASLVSGATQSGAIPPTTVAPGELAFTPPKAPPAPPAPPPAAPLPPEPQQVFWGRWSTVADLEALQSKTPGELFQTDGPYAIGRLPNSNFGMPVSGIFDFKLDSSSAALFDKAGNATAASILNPLLTVNFGQREFNTRFDLSANGATYNVMSRGSVLANGRMVSEIIQPGVNATVQGALGGSNATQAGFIFSRVIDEKTGVTAAGATSWSR